MAKLKLSATGSNLTAEQKTKEVAKKATETKQKTPFKRENLNQFIEQDKIDILNHHAQDTLWIGAKDGGKSRSVIFDTLVDLEEDYRCMGLALKKYKTNAATRLHTLFQNAAIEVKYAGFTIPSYEKGQSETYRMVKAVKTENQMIEYAGLDDYNALAGIEAKNLGYFKKVIVEEPVAFDDEGKLPTIPEWRGQMSTIKDSVSRSNRKHMSVFNRVVPPTKYHYTMNPWDNHPLIIYAEEHFPEKKFFEWIKKDLLNNNIMTHYVEEDDTLIVRNTKFNNPIIRLIEMTLKHFKIETVTQWNAFDKTKIDWESAVFKRLQVMEAHFYDHLKKNKGTILNAAKDAIDAGDSLLLAQLLGLKYESDGRDKRTYNVSKLEENMMDTDKTLPAEKVSPLYMAWDLDQRRGFVLTWGYSVTKERIGEEPITNIITRPQVYIPCSGVGDKGQKMELYIDLMVKEMEKAHKWYTMNAKKATTPITMCAVDDNYKHYIPIFSKKLPYIHFSLAKKHGSWDIAHRTSWTQTAFDLGYIILDVKNQRLLADFKKSIIREGQTQRDESGQREKDYDYINSFEYFVYFLRAQAYTSIKAGTPSDYNL